MDEADQSEQVIEMELANAMARALRTPVIVATGHCLNCGDDLAPALRWCDADCLDDWTRSQRARA